MSAAPTARAKTAVCEALRPGGARHQGPRGWPACHGRARRPMSQRARSVLGSNRGHSTRPACVSRVAARSPMRSRATSARGSCDDAADASTRARSIASPRASPRSRGWPPCAAPVGRPRPGPDRAADRRRRSSSAGRSSRCRRSGSRSRSCWWLWAVRRVDAAHPANPVPRRRTVAFLAGMTRPGVRPAVGDRPLRHGAVLGPHGPARAADAGRRAAPRPRARRSRWCFGWRRRRRAAAGSCRSCIRG